MCTLPLGIVSIRSNDLAPWLDAARYREKQWAVRRAERFCSCGLGDDGSKWIQLLGWKHEYFKNTGQHYWEGLISSDSKDSRRLWNDLSAILGTSHGWQGPSVSSEDYLFTFAIYLCQLLFQCCCFKCSVCLFKFPHWFFLRHTFLLRNVSLPTTFLKIYLWHLDLVGAM